MAGQSFHFVISFTSKEKNKSWNGRRKSPEILISALPWKVYKTLIYRSIEKCSTLRVSWQMSTKVFWKCCEMMVAYSPFFLCVLILWFFFLFFSFFLVLILSWRLCCANENFILGFHISKQLSCNQTHDVINIYLRENYNRNIKNHNICPLWFCNVFIKFMRMLMRNTECFWFLGLYISI